MNFAQVEMVVWANDNDAFVPEMWVNESLMVLDDSLVMAGLVHRGFEDAIANEGDIVNTRRPNKFRTTRKVDGENIVTQDAVSTNVQVKLNQRIGQSFLIHDGEWSKSFLDLSEVYLAPAVQAVARGIDRALMGHVHNLYGAPATRAGKLAGLSSATARDYLLEARQILNLNNAPDENRVALISPTSETSYLKTDLFVAANQRGDNGTALEMARLGRLYDFDVVRGRNVPRTTASGVDTVAGTITNAASAGTTGSQACTVTGYEVQVGEFVNVAGNDQPTYATAATVSTNTTAVTLNEALKYATSALAVLTVYKSIDVKGAFAADYHKEIVVDGWTNAPVAGQLIAFGTGGNRRTYTIIESYLSAAGEQSILLDRPLEVALTDNQLAFPGPIGEFNMAFHRNFLALITRPLADPPAGAGVVSMRGTANGLSLRLQMQYDSLAQATRFNVDVLFGIKTLDEQLGVMMLG